MEAWYALHVRSQSEQVVESALQEKGLDAFYPSFRVTTKRKKVLRRPFFPGYVFSRFELPYRRPVIVIPQVIQIVGVGDQPVAIPEVEIESCRILVTAPVAATAQPLPLLSIGDEVLVKSGPLAGVQGILAYVKNQARIVVSVWMLGQAVSAEVDITAVEVVNPVKAAA